MRIAVLANWGVGAEILYILARNKSVTVSFAISDFDKNTKNKWKNAVYDAAKAYGIECLNASNLTQREITQRLSKVDLMICHAWKNILPAELFSAPRFGSVNLHPSLLPRHRGPCPHLWVLKSGDREHGLTSHIMDEGIDTGPIIAQEKINLFGKETPKQLVDLLKPLVAPVLNQTINRILDPNFQAISQDETRATYARRI